MVDREKVISDLEEQIAWIRDNDFHKFPGWGHAVLAMRDALALLKAQEPPTDVSISSAIECLLHPQDADDSDMAKAIDTAVRAMRLLKEQEPRVMIWQDVIGAVIQCKPLYIEMKYIDYEEPGGNRWAMMTQYGDSLTNGMICAMSSYIKRETLFKDWYNKTWRCWTSRPTDEVRRATPWE